MTEDIQEFNKLIKEKNIIDVDTMMEESKKLTEKIPDFKEKYEKAIRARGYIVDLSIVLEIAFDELITKTGGEDLVMNHEKREFHLITGAKKENEVGGLSFKDKARIVKEIIMKISKEESSPQDPTILDNLERLVAIRDLFAHVPMSWFAKELEFDDNPRYKHFFKLDSNWKKVSIAVNEFMNLEKNMMELIPVYIKLVILKREIFSNILLGGNYNDILKKYKGEMDKKDDTKL